MSSNSSGSSTPFEWLSGGLFFAKKDVKPSAVDTCRDVNVLLDGVRDGMNQLFHMEEGALENEDIPSDDAKTQQREEVEGLVSAKLRRLRYLLYEERRQSSQTESARKPAVASRMSELLTTERKQSDLTALVPMLLRNLPHLPFETRKDVSAIFSYLLLCGLEGADAEGYQKPMADFRDYIQSNFAELMPVIVHNHDCGASGSSTPDLVLHSGAMFRSCMKHVCLYQQLVSTTENVALYVYPFLDLYVHSPNFDCASDAMDSLKAILTGGAEGEQDEETQYERYQLAATFLERDYEAIWDERFNPKLLASEGESNYLIRRMALQILAIVLLTRSNYQIMVRYIASKQNLILIMLLLRDQSPHITLDAFHVFKIFVANPSKPPEVVKILSDNKIKLCTYLEGLHKEKEASDSQFRDEKALVVSTIEAL
jgi:calcium binding protein 39